MNNDKIKRRQLGGTPIEGPEDLLDVTELVRSLQRREGNPDCFRKAQGYCDKNDCWLRHWCLENPEDPWKEE